MKPTRFAKSIFLVATLISLFPAHAQTNARLAIQASGGQAALTVTGPRLDQYVLQVSTNLASGWTFLAPVQADMNGNAATNYPLTTNSATYYRVLTHPPVRLTTPVVEVTENIPQLFQLTAAGQTNNSPNGGITFLVDGPTSIGKLYQVAADNITPGPAITNYFTPVSNVDGWLYYIPLHDYYNDPGTGDYLLYQAADYFGLYANGEGVVIDVNHVNQPPVADNQIINGYNSSLFTQFTLQYSDPDNQLSDLTIFFVTLPTNGVVSTATDLQNPVPVVAGQPYPTNSFIFTSGKAFAYGTNYATFTFYVQDPGGLQSPLATNTVNLADLNDPPTPTTPTNYNTIENSKVLITLTGTDPQNDNLFFYITSLPPHGTLFYDNVNLTQSTLPVELPANPGVNPQITYMPATNYNGTDTIGYAVADRLGLTPPNPDEPVPGAISITIAPVNQAPVISGETNGITVHEDSGGNITQDGVITNLTITDDASETPGAQIDVTISPSGIGNGYIYLPFGYRTTVTVSTNRSGDLTLEGPPATITAFIGNTHVFYHPLTNGMAAQIQVIANDNGYTGPGGVPGTPLLTTNTFPVIYATP